MSSEKDKKEVESDDPVEKDLDEVSTEDEEADEQRLQELEAKAVDKAKATADAAFRPSPQILNAQSAAALLAQVDGPSLKTYEGKESVYVGRSIPVQAGGKLNIPIQVTCPGSVVEYAVELKACDIGFGITAERDEGITVVKEHSRVDVSECPVTQKFLVGTVPCLIQFAFDNEYSWFKEKLLSYKITVTPPSRESLAAGRRRRAQACLRAVEDDLDTAASRLDAATQQKLSLEEDVARLMTELNEKKKSMQVAVKEEAWLKERKTLRTEQRKLLKQRLEEGWEDEKTTTTAANGD